MFCRRHVENDLPREERMKIILALPKVDYFIDDDFVYKSLCKIKSIFRKHYKARNSF